MYEEYYTQLPDVSSYLKRLGMSRPEILTKDYLDQLVLNHQCKIAFENLDIFDFGRPISLEIEKLFNKVVTYGRGGYCFELNGLFSALLRALGYDAWSVPCRLIREPTDTPGPVMHRGNMLKIDGKYCFCDVGYGGPMPPGGVWLEEGVRQVIEGETFWFERKDDFWWTLWRLTKTAENINAQGNEANELKPAMVLSVTPAAWEPTDYIALNRVCSEGPTAHFKRIRMVNIRRPDGYIAINGNTLTEVKDGVKTITELDDEKIRAYIRDELNLLPIAE
jgi:N-hydroxyarylamine O-acetyltransferase